MFQKHCTPIKVLHKYGSLSYLISNLLVSLYICVLVKEDFLIIPNSNITSKLTTSNRVPLEKLTVAQLVKKFPTFY